MKQCPTCGEVYEVTKSCPCPVRGGARRGAGKHPIFDEALTRVNVSLDPATIAFYKKHGASLSEGIRQYWRGLTQPAPDAWESAPKKAVSKPKVLSTSQTLSKPTKRR